MDADATVSIGSSSIVDEKTHEPILSILSVIVETAVKLHTDGHRVIIVSSGAIAVGLRRMDMEKRPKRLSRIQVWVTNRGAGRTFSLLKALQALAAVGQCRLMSLWDSLFAHLQQPVAQILLTRNDIADVGHCGLQEEVPLLTIKPADTVPECPEHLY